MRFPIGDWQFWAATLAVLLALAYVLRGVLPIPLLSRRARRRKAERKATLTVKGKAIDP